MEYNIHVKEDGLYKAILTLMDPMLTLTVTERYVLTEILKLNPRVLNSTNRVLLKESTGHKKYSLNNHIKSLKDKNILVYNTRGELAVAEHINRMVKDNTITVNFIVNEQRRKES